MSLENLRKCMRQNANQEKAKVLQRFFKTGKGEYAEGDIFLGITVPEIRKISLKFNDLSFYDIQELMKSEIHEERLAALLLLVNNFKQAEKNKEEGTKDKICKFYIKNTKYINNWDLVDLSAQNILGNYLINKDKSIIYILSQSKNLWERRISIISTYAFIKNNRFEDALKISKILIKDKHDLIHKAVGWMLREVGKRDKEAEKNFLKDNYKFMPRTMLRYAIEKFPESERKEFLEGKI